MVFRLALVVLLAPVLGGCGPGGRGGVVEQIVEQSYAFPAGGELTVHNAEGSIRIYCSENAGMHLRATKKAYSTARVQKIQIKIANGAASAAVDTIFPEEPRWGFRDRSGAVDYVIVVPETTRLKNLEVVNGEISIDDLRGGSATARLVNGRMFSRNCFGDLDLAVTNGRLDFFYDWWLADDRFLARGAIQNGHIDALIPRGSSFRVDVETMDGRIVNRFGEAGNGAGHAAKLETTIGSDPNATFQIRATHGNIYFQEAY